MNKPADADLSLDLGLSWRNRFAALGTDFSTRLQPAGLRSPYWVGRSRAAAQALGLAEHWLESDAALQAFTGNLPLAGSAPLASVYSGHQFGVWAGQLGDGRALLLGEVAPTGGAGHEIQLKGGGLTPYSRMGDGRAVLRSSIREFLCSEAMHGLGIPTTRALCVTGSDDPVRRETLETAAVVTRTAPSFIRFGHFEHFSYNEQHAQLQRLADFVIDGFYPECRDSAHPYAALLGGVARRTASLMAQWQGVGFCHGVMNTDNMSILGLTIDYGPFQFMDGFNPGHICNHSDTQGRYAWNRQPNVAYWNLFCLGQALLPLIGEQDEAVAALEPYKQHFADDLQATFSAKLGLEDARHDDRALIEGILALLAAHQVDFTIFWRRLCSFVPDAPNEPLRDLFPDRAAFDAWAVRYSARIRGGDTPSRQARMLRTNPKFVLRNHLGEQAIRRAREKDCSEVQNLLTLLESPFDEHPGFEDRAGFPPEWAAGIEISCSS